MDEFLRNECKYLKCYQGITYKEIADYLGIKQDSFYNWLKGYYDFGYKRRTQLQYIISTLKEQ
jgi:transposase